MPIPRKTVYKGLEDPALAVVPVEAKEMYFRVKMYLRDKGVCGICGEPVAFEDMQLDHILPVSLGGEAVWENLRCAHRRCNTRRGNGHVPRTCPVGKVISLRPELFAAVQMLAETDSRRLSSQVALMLEEWLVAHGMNGFLREEVRSVVRERMDERAVWGTNVTRW